jgi:hypothetical protein
MVNGYGKIRFCGDQAMKDNWQYFWIYSSSVSSRFECKSDEQNGWDVAISLSCEGGYIKDPKTASVEI